MTETSSSVAPLSVDNALIGTVEYMAPEQLNGEAVDARADIFALGVVLYEMLTGARPFAGHNRASVIGAILFATPEPPSVKRTDILPALDRILSTCLQKDRDERIQTAHDLKLQLEWIRDGASGVSSFSNDPTQSKKPQRQSSCNGETYSRGAASLSPCERGEGSEGEGRYELAEMIVNDGGRWHRE